MTQANPLSLLGLSRSTKKIPYQGKGFLKHRSKKSDRVRLVLVKLLFCLQPIFQLTARLAASRHVKLKSTLPNIMHIGNIAGGSHLSGFCLVCCLFCRGLLCCGLSCCASLCGRPCGSHLCGFLYSCSTHLQTSILNLLISTKYNSN